MKILALEPYYGGSHKAFLDGLKEHSSHDWTILGLPDYKWKWRMRHSAVTFAEQVNELQKQIGSATDEGRHSLYNGQPQEIKQARSVDGRCPHLPQKAADVDICQPQKKVQNWDLIFCSDMLNLAEFKGLVDAPVKNLPTVLYFHENQLTYPVQNRDERDLHLAMINFTSCLSATEIWFNSRFHQTSYLNALQEFLKRMPDNNHLESIEIIRQKSSVVYPGIDNIPNSDTRIPGLIRILWAARWEYDKDPETFFKAIKILKEKDIDFKLSVIGPKFSEVPSIFEEAKKEFSDDIDHWGYQETREEYIKVLQNADVVASTAKHEFFGISMIEAISAGAYPLLPHRLSYPELLGEQNQDDFFYDGSAEGLALNLIQLNTILMNKPELFIKSSSKAAQIVKKYQWNAVINNIDAKIISIISR